jgi:hypothetical protein
MFEWMPVLSGAVLGLLHLRGRITQRTLLCLAVLIACGVTAISGELFDAPALILVDLALVAAGVCVPRVLASTPRASRSLRAAYASRAAQTRQDHHNDPSP